jgi:hypothetical protein
VPICPPQNPTCSARTRTRAAAVGSQRLTAWAMARPLFGCKWDDVTRGCTKQLHNEELHNFYYVSNIVRITKSNGISAVM